MSRRTGRPRGQPTKLTEKRLEKFLSARRLNMSLVDACDVAGYDVSSHENYMVRGQVDESVGKDTLYARYFREAPRAKAVGKYRLKRRVMDIARNEKATIADVHRAKLLVSVETMSDSSRQGWARLRLQRLELELRAPPPPAAPEERESVPLRRLSAEDFTRYQVLAERLRTRFDEVTPEEVRELQALIRKAKEAGVPSTTEQVPGAEHPRG